MINFYIASKRFFLKRKELSDGRVVSISKKEHGSAIHFLQRLIKSQKSISDEFWDAICLSCHLFGIFMIKK